MEYIDFLNDKLFSFTYGGTDSEELLAKCAPEVKKTTENDVHTTHLLFRLPDGLEITQTIREFTKFGATEWHMEFCNTAVKDSRLLEHIRDCDVKFPFGFDRSPEAGYIPDESVLKIYNPAGSNWQRDEFVCRITSLLPGEERYYAPEAGRSSQAVAPFFDVNKDGGGFLAAVGWSGQWCAAFTRDDNCVRVCTGLEDCAFYLYPQEKVRTTSVLLMPYTGGQDAAHNRFRRLIKQHFSVIGQPGRPEEAPLSYMTWGGLTSDILLERIKTLKENNLDYEYFWIDAAWYGQTEEYCPDEFHLEWSEHTGDWSVNKHIHPQELADVAKAVKNSGMRFLLWMEPERVVAAAPIVREHPEWFLSLPDGTYNKKPDGLLLNLGRDDVLQYVTELVSGLIRRLDLKCYRQDFNIDPLPFWRLHELSGRKGINEIKYVTNLYRFWDTLLDRFPDLIIDNCASGGKRIDIETLKRSIPLWRSDYQCTSNHDREATQIHNSGISWWLPYSGTGSGYRTWNNNEDTYNVRSAYSASLAMRVKEETEDPLHTKEPDKIEWLKVRIKEYKEIRPFFSCDYYPLIPISLDHSCWTAWQYDRPENGDGIFMFFRRSKSPFDRLTVFPDAMQSGKTYRFVCKDTGEERVFSAEDLRMFGFTVTLSQQQTSEVWTYFALHGNSV